MNKEEIVQIMLDSFEKNNTQLCINAGMAEDEVAEKTLHARQTMKFLLENIYSTLEEKGIIKSA